MPVSKEQQIEHLEALSAELYYKVEARDKALEKYMVINEVLLARIEALEAGGDGLVRNH